MSSEDNKVAMSLADWKKLLESCNDRPAKIILFDDAFAGQWKGETVTISDDDRSAAAKLHIQLVSRITTQRLPYIDGEEASALDSVYRLFGEAREIFKKHPESSVTDAVVWHIMNGAVRDFTAKWHRQNVRGALAALDATDIFRHELAILQKYLVRFDAILMAIRDGTELPQLREPGNTSRERKIAREMAGELPWGIHPQLGGLDATTAQTISDEERKAVLARRAHYRRQIDPPPAEETPEQALARQPFATGLAISGGGIRSATFALGVLAALARRNLLPQFDYLSTVSGGGYLGSFLTTYLSTDALAVGDVKIGLMRDDLPFRRKDGEAAALRHIRHHSKYLATGRLWERLQMAFAQVFGMAMNGLGFAYLAFAAALAEYLLRLIPLPPALWSTAVVIVAVMLAATPFLVPFIRKSRRLSEWPDKMVAGLSVVLLLLLAWRGLGEIHRLVGENQGLPLGPGLIVAAAITLLAAATVTLAANLPLPIRIALIVVAAIAAPILFIGLELVIFDRLRGMRDFMLVFDAALVGFVLFFALFDINFTAPHRHYKHKLGEAYLIQPDAQGPATRLKDNVSLQLSDCTGGGRAPYHLINCALDVPASRDSRMQGRLTDFFLFSRDYCGSPLTGYCSTKEWQRLNPDLDLGTSMAISGAAAAPQMGTGTIRNLSFWLALFNIRLGYWIRNPLAVATNGNPPGLPYLLSEMFGWADEKRPYLNVSDGGHVENLGVYELLRRRCKYIVAVDGEQDEKMTFQGLTTLLRLAYIDLGITIDIGLDALRLAETGLSHSHFAFCRIHYPKTTRDGEESYGYLLYLKLSVTGNEGEFIHRYRLDEPAFPHTSTANQFFTEAQFEAYRSLGEHVGDKMFLPAIVGEAMAAGNADVDLEQWFQEIGRNMLDPLPPKNRRRQPNMVNAILTPVAT